jgi:membrane protease YdiL (CAAX protease family)
MLLEILFGLSGILLGILAILLLPPPQPIIPLQTWYWYLFGVIILTVFSGFTEEIIFRGLIQDAFSYKFGLAGVFISAGLYTALFFGTLQPLTIVFFGLTGLIFAIWVKYSRSLLGVIIAHSLLNIIFLLVNHVH